MKNIFVECSSTQENLDVNEDLVIKKPRVKQKPSDRLLIQDSQEESEYVKGFKRYHPINKR